jgi:DNA helicase-2/ATP-dependent DNA helicase PcrA
MSRKWSPQQEEIFKYFEKGKGNAIVSAMAGTGKTTTILEGVRRAPELSRLVCAFNKRIAQELEEKLEGDHYTTAKTLHAIGLKIIQNNVKVQIDDKRGEKIVKKVCEGTGAPKQVLGMIQKLASLSKEMIPMVKEAAKMASIAEDFDCVPDEFNATQGFDLHFVCARAYRCLELAADVEADRSVDFSDMLFVPLRNKWAKGGYDLVVVDEAQDMNAAQLMLSMQIAKRGGRIVVVGDKRQAIYAFRGADSTSMDRLKTHLNAKEYGLTITYRCPKKVVQLAQEIVPEYTAADEAPDGVVKEIAGEEFFQRTKEGDFVISRLNAPLMGTCIRLIREGKKARIEGRDLGSGLLSLVTRLYANDIDSLLNKLDTWEDKQVAKYQKRRQPSRVAQVQDQADMLRVLAEDCDSLRDLEQRIKELFIDAGDRKEFIICSSIHKAKGLEADRVFVLFDTLYPRPGSRTSMEEQNLHYVAVTRSKKELYLVMDVGTPAWKAGLREDAADYSDGPIRMDTAEAAKALATHFDEVAVKHHGPDALIEMSEKEEP